MTVQVVLPENRHSFSLWLDAVRWLSAFIVVINHAGGILLLPLSETPKHLRPLPQYAYSFVAGFAHYAVVIFFVMSGYFVGGSWLRVTNKQGRELAIYFSKRLTRLYVVLLPVLILTPLLTTAGIRIFPGVDGSGIYPSWAIQSSTYSVALCNALYLQNILCAQAGGNQALWSLPHEFWYYVAFPLFFLGRASSIAGALLLFTLTMFQTSHAPIILYFLIWLVGLSVTYVPRLRLSMNLTLPLFILAIIIARMRFDFGDGFRQFVVDIMLAIMFAIVMISMRDSKKLAAPAGGALHRELSSFSYTLYCSHMPILFLYSSLCMATIGVGRRETPTDMLHWTVALTGIIVAILAAWLLSLITERNTERVRTSVASLIRRAHLTA